jgi:hypothetical protein
VLATGCTAVAPASRFEASSPRSHDTATANIATKIGPETRIVIAAIKTRLVQPIEYTDPLSTIPEEFLTNSTPRCQRASGTPPAARTGCCRSGRASGFTPMYGVQRTWGKCQLGNGDGAASAGRGACGSLEPWTVTDCGFLNLLATEQMCRPAATRSMTLLRTCRTELWWILHCATVPSRQGALDRSARSRA